MEVEVSKHARKQIKSRLGVPMKAVDKLAQKAWDEGKTHKDFSGTLMRYLNKLHLSHKNNSAKSYRVMGDYIFFFTKEAILVTAYLLPEDIRRKHYK